MGDKFITGCWLLVINKTVVVNLSVIVKKFFITMSSFFTLFGVAIVGSLHAKSAQDATK